METLTLVAHDTVAIAEAMLASTIGTVDDHVGVFLDAVLLARPLPANRGVEVDRLVLALLLCVCRIKHISYLARFI